MQLSEIMALVNAGYTKADIEALGGSQAQQAPEQPAQPAQTEQPAQPAQQPAQPAQQPAQPAQQPAQPAEQPAQPAQQPAQPAEQPAQTQPAQSQQPETDRYAKLEALLTQLIGTQQAANINASGPAAAQPARTSTDILGSVIAPPRKDIKK